MRMPRPLLFKIIPAAAALGLSLTAQASPYTFLFNGLVSSNNPMAGVPALDSPIAGSYTIDVAQTGGVGANCLGIANCWADSKTRWSLNGMTYDPTNPVFLFFDAQTFGVRITLTDNAPGAGPDKYEVSFGGQSLDTIKLTLWKTDGAAFENLANPLLATLANFDYGTFSDMPLCATGISCATNPYYTARVTGFALLPPPVAVPLPAGLALLAPALVALRHRRRAAPRFA